jgi:DnaJ-class molecular chaperone
MDANEREILAEIERREEAKEKPCEMCNGCGVIRGHVCHFCLGRRIELTETEYKTLIAVADDNRILNDEFIN